MGTKEKYLDMSFVCGICEQGFVFMSNIHMYYMYEDRKIEGQINKQTDRQ